MSDNNFNGPDPFCEKEKAKGPIIKVVGVGGGGGNAVTHMFKTGIRNVTFALCNTDRQVLLRSEIPSKVQIGPGLGAGGRPEEGRRIAEENLDMINAMFDDDTQMVFITAGMGGGTGTGAAPVVARVARERNLLTIGIVTIPFLFEKKSKIMQAWKGVEEMRKNVDALLIINNERLCEIYPDLNFINAFEKADDTLTNAAKSVAELITVEGKINVDFADVSNTLRNGGVAIMGSGMGEGDNRILKAFEDALRSPLLKEGDVNNATRILFNIYIADECEHPVSMAEIAQIHTFMERFGNDVEVIWGCTVDNSLGDSVKVTLLATGFNVDSEIQIQMRQENVARVKPERIYEQDIISEVYGSNAEDRMFMDSVRSSYVIFTLEEMDDDAFIEKVIKTPAYKRPANFKQQLRETEAREQKKSEEKKSDSGKSKKGDGGGDDASAKQIFF